MEFVENFSHEALFDIGPLHVRETISRSTHALGNVETGEQLRYIEDFTTPFAFQHLFHWYVESFRSLPTWTQFRDWMVEGPAAPFWYIPLREFLEKFHSSDSRERWSRAARWRLGKVYLSNMREIDLLARVRAAGIPLKYHLIADVLFRVDFWTDRRLICTYFPNSAYRDREAGRKPPASYYFSEKPGAFTIHHLPIARQGFGNVWLASDDAVELVAGVCRGA